MKVGTDADAASVNPTPHDATVAMLGNIPAPAHPGNKPAARYPTELKTFTVPGTVTLVRRESDDDYHVVIRDAGRTMIVEFPSPACARGSRFEPRIRAARAAIDARIGAPLGAGRRSIHPNWKVRVTGVAFFDIIHGQTGVAPNGIELHPVLDVNFQ